MALDPGRGACRLQAVGSKSAHRRVHDDQQFSNRKNICVDREPKMHALLLTFALSLGEAGNGRGNDVDFTFPSSVGTARSTTGSLVVGYRDPGEDRDGVHEYEFRILDRVGRLLARVPFTRSVEGSWSPDGNNVAVNNYIGSNIADCLISKRSRSGLSLLSVTNLLSGPVNSRRWTDVLRIPEGPENSHFYVTCVRWENRNSVEISVAGYTDTQADFGREFSYRLRFAPSSQSFERIRLSP